MTSMTSNTSDLYEKLGLPFSERIMNYNAEIQDSILQYLTNLDEKERKAYIIAYKHLGTSFNVIKSTGYINWEKKKQ